MDMLRVISELIANVWTRTTSNVTPRVNTIDPSTQHNIELVHLGNVIFKTTGRPLSKTGDEYDLEVSSLDN